MPRRGNGNQQRSGLPTEIPFMTGKDATQTRPELPDGKKPFGNPALLPDKIRRFPFAIRGFHAILLSRAGHDCNSVHAAADFSTPGEVRRPFFTENRITLRPYMTFRRNGHERLLSRALPRKEFPRSFRAGESHTGKVQ